MEKGVEENGEARAEREVASEEVSLFSTLEKTIEICFNAILNRNLNLVSGYMAKELGNQLRLETLEQEQWDSAIKDLQNWKITRK